MLPYRDRDSTSTCQDCSSTLEGEFSDLGPGSGKGGQLKR